MNLVIFGSFCPLRLPDECDDDPEALFCCRLCVSVFSELRVDGAVLQVVLCELFVRGEIFVEEGVGGGAFIECDFGVVFGGAGEF